MNTPAAEGGIIERTWWASRSDAQYETVTLYRVNGSTEELLDRITVTPDQVPSFEDFQLLVKEEFGGGIYVAVQRAPSGAFAMRERFAVAGFAKRPKGEPEAETPRNDLAALLMNMQDRADERMAKLVESLRPSVTSDPLEQVERVASILGKTGATPQPQRTLLEMLAEAKQVAELLNPGGDEGGGLMEVLQGFAPILMNLGQQGGAAKPAPAEPGKPAQLPGPEDQKAQIARLTRIVAGLVVMADGEASPAKQAVRLKREAGQQWPQLLMILQREDAVAMAAQLVPKVAEHAEWFEALRREVLAQEGGEGGTTGGSKPGTGTGGGKGRKP